MANVVRVFKTVGPLEGKTVALAGLQFTDGKAIFRGPQADADNLGTYLNRCWQVEVVEDESGAAPIVKTPEQQPNKTQQIGNERLAEALKKLDPNNDEHWTQLGKPTMKAVEQMYGSTDITRADVEAAIPDFDRDMARALQQ